MRKLLNTLYVTSPDTYLALDGENVLVLKEQETLLRVPGVGPVSARRIVSARRCGMLRFEDLKKLGVVVKRAQYFLTCGGKYLEGLRVSPDGVLRHLVAQERPMLAQGAPEQLSLFEQTG